MPLQLTCSSCQKKLNVRDELAGKRIKCPGCAATLPVPLPTAEPAAEPEEEPEVTTESTREDRPRKRSKKRKSKISRPAEPIFTLGSVEFTLGKLLAVGGMVLVFGVVVTLLLTLTPVGAIFSSAPDAQAVDVYTAVNGFRDTKVGAIILQAKSTPYSIPGHKKILVTRPNPNGGYLLVTFRVSSKEVADAFAGVRGPISLMTLTAEHVKLQAGGETIPALYVMDQNKNGKRGYHFGWDPPKQEGFVPNLRDHLGPGKKGWTHEGTTKDAGDTITFDGIRGMGVNTQIGGERLDGGEDRSALSDLTGAKMGKDFGGGLVSGPSDYVLVTWDKDSTGWMLDDAIEQPNDIALSWQIMCFFPRPKDAGKDAQLIVLGKPRSIRIR